METVLSGIRPTGNLHLGNYYGAVTSFIKLQDLYRCFFFIADWHSLTTHPTPENIQNSVRTILDEYLACGLDPEKATIYVQSDVPEVVELYIYLNMNAYLGELERVTSFKEKARKQPDNVKTVESLPLGSRFVLKNGLVFQKGEKQRTRYKCYCESNGRWYFVSALAEVQLILK